jgi:TolB protein
MADLRRVMSMTRIWCPLAAVCAVALAAGVSPAHAAFPGTNGKIAFISDRQGDAFDIWTMNPNGQRLANLTATPHADELWPNWRADGRKIAFISNPVTAANPEGDYELFVMDADGSHPVQLTFNGLDDERPAWSPDGSRIAFSRDFDPIEGQIDNDLFTMNADGTNERRLTNSPTVQDQEPNWSANGKTIAFVSDRDGDYEVFTMRPNGSNVRQLTFNDAQEFAPNWSPDSRMLVFASGQDDNFSIFTMRADGTRQRNLTDDAGDGWPAWAPDGRKIVFASFRDATDEDPDNAEIYTMDADGSNQVNRTENPAFDFQPDWQPLDNDRHDRRR